MALAFTVIGKYQVVDRLGEGGMGTLYLARDPALDRLVAIKVLRGDFDSEDLRERFTREARSISRLRHPNIVTIFEYGDFHDQPFIAMEYIAGESLAELVRRRASLPVARRLQMMEEVCAGMAYAHRARIVHRDLKPANLMVDADGGLIKILDFGIARSLEASFTRFTQVIGTPSYMSPEQASAKRIDHRSDIFSIGAVFYELLSYQRAFDGESQFTVLHKIQNEDPPPLTRVAAGLDPAIVRIVKKALERDPAQRYQDLEAMRRDIALVRERIGQAAEEPTVVSPGAVSPTTPWAPSQLEKLRAAQVKQYLEAAETAFEKHDYQAAIDSCEQVLLLHQTNAPALAMIERARTALEESAVQGHLRRARELLNAQAITEAEEALTQALRLRSSDPAAIAFQRELQQVRRERERAQERAAAAELALARARVCLAEGAFEPALRAASEALAHAPDSTEAREIKDQAAAAIERRTREEQRQRQISSALDTAHRKFEAGDHAGAIADLERFEPPASRITDALEELRRRRHAIELERRAEEERRLREAEERRREEERRKQQEEARKREEERQAILQQVAHLMAEARRLIDGATLKLRGTSTTEQDEAGKDFEAALARLGEVRQLDATTPDLVALQRTAEIGRAAATERRQLLERMNAASELLDAGRLEEAEQEAAAARDLDADDESVQRLSSKIQQAIDDRRRAEELARRADAVSKQAHRQFGEGAFEEALAKLRDFEPSHPLIDQTLAELQSRYNGIQQRALAAIQSAEQQFDAGDFETAVEALDTFTPATPAIVNARIDLRQRIDAVLEQQRAAELERRARAATQEAQEQFERGAFDQALTQLQRFEPSHPLVTEVLASLRGRYETLLRRALEAMSAAEHRLEIGDYDAALDELERFTPPTPAIATARNELHRQIDEAIEQRRVEEEQRQREEAEHRAAEEQRQREEEKRRAAEQHEREEAERRAAEELRRRQEADREAAEQRRREEAERRAAEEQRRREEAERRALEEQRQREEAERRAEEERQRLEAVERRRRLSARVAAARVSFDERRLDEALREVEAALAIDAADASALSLKARVNQAIDERKRAQELDSRARRAVDKAHRAFDRGDHQQALALLEQFEPTHPRVQTALVDLRTRAEAIAAAKEQEERRRREETERGVQRQWLDSQLQDAQRAADEARFDDALKTLAGVRAKMPDAPGVSELEKTTIAARTTRKQAERDEQQKLEILAEALSAIDTHLSRGEIDLAEQALAGAETRLGAREELRTRRGRIEALRRSRGREEASRPVVPANKSGALREPAADALSGPRPVAPAKEVRPLQPVPIEPAAPPRVRSAYWMAAAIVAGAIVVVASFLWSRSGPPPPPSLTVLIPLDARSPVGPQGRLPNVRPSRPINHDFQTAIQNPPLTTSAATTSSIVATTSVPPTSVPLTSVPPTVRPTTSVPPTVRPTTTSVPPATTTIPVVDPQVVDRRAIELLLRQYVDAYSALNASKVAELDMSQSASQLERAFAGYSMYSVNLVGVQTMLSGDTATVTCVRQIEVVPKRGGERQRQSPPTTFTLRRIGGVWRIQSVR